MEDLFEGGRQSECVRERKRGGEGKEGRKRWNQISETRRVKDLEASNYYTAFTPRSKERREKKSHKMETNCHDKVVRLWIF